MNYLFGFGSIVLFAFALLYYYLPYCEFTGISLSEAFKYRVFGAFMGCVGIFFAWLSLYW